MNNFGYNVTKTIRDYEWLRFITLLAGGLGLVQALIWIGLSITAILSYNCIISVEPLSYGSVIGVVLVQRYFKGSCTPNGMLGYDFTVLNSVNTVLNSAQLLIWSSTYLIVASCWFLASVLLITQLNKQSVRLTSSLIISWAVATICICILDAILGILFSIDYSRFHAEAFTYNLSSQLSGIINPDGVQLTAGYVSALFLLFISFKAFILYVVNFTLVIYLLVLASRVIRDIDTNDTLFIVRKDSDNVLDRPPISAFEEPKQTSYVNNSYIAESVETVELNQEAIVRAARMSNDVSTMDRRFRNLDSYQQYPPQRANPSVVNNNNRNAPNGDSQFPVPDYTPPMSRAYRGYQ